MASEAGGSYPFRLVLHRTKGGNHADLFIRTPERQLLLTYEISTEDLRLLFPSGAGLRFPTASTLQAGRKGSQEQAVARAKEQHRLMYWDYSGEISGGRGRIRELTRGTVHNFFYEPELFLMRID